MLSPRTKLGLAKPLGRLSCREWPTFIVLISGTVIVASWMSDDRSSIESIRTETGCITNKKD